MPLQISKLKLAIDSLQKKYGHPDYAALYGTGCIKNPDLFLIFMNPTARNVSVHKGWKGLQASWIGTKNTWKMLFKLGFLPKDIHDEIQRKKPVEWDNDLAMRAYSALAAKKIFITNLGRSTQPDARPLPNALFRACRSVMEEEIQIVNPKVIITFGNQESSALLGKPIKVSEERGKKHELVIGKKRYPVYATYYPVGMGIMNMEKAIEDIKKIY